MSSMKTELKILLLTNFASVFLTVLGFVIWLLPQPEANSTAAQDTSFQQRKKMYDRLPSSFHITEEAVRLAEAKAEIVKLKRQLQFDPTDWRDHVQKVHQGTMDIKGEILSKQDLYRPFYDELYKVLSAEFGEEEAGRRMALLMELKHERDQELDKIDKSEADYRYAEMNRSVENQRMHQNIKKKSAEISKLQLYNQEEFAEFMEQYEEEQRRAADARLSAPFDKKRDAIANQYNFEKEKLMGTAYLTAEKLKEQFNDDYHKTYGNNTFLIYEYFDQDQQSMMPYDEPVEREIPNHPRVKIDL